MKHGRYSKDCFNKHLINRGCLVREYKGTWDDLYYLHQADDLWIPEAFGWRKILKEHIVLDDEDGSNLNLQGNE